MLWVVASSIPGDQMDAEMTKHSLKAIYQSMQSGSDLPHGFCLGQLTPEQRTLIMEKTCSLYTGKVREMVEAGTGDIYMLHSDRLSAFDKHICNIPGKGIVLSELTKFWLEATKSQVPNHYLSSPDQTPFKLEVIVRGYMAGSMWRIYSNGGREICGVKLDDGIENYAKLKTPILTPSSKAEAYSHDENITRQQITDTGLATTSQWEEMSNLALKLFELGTKIYANIGWILVDTKYEFGLDVHGSIMLIDELHTPDSSRLWLKESYNTRINQGHAPEMFDKESVRTYLIDQGYMGEGKVPKLPEKKKLELARNYLEIYEKLTNTELSFTSCWDKLDWFD